MREMVLFWEVFQDVQNLGCYMVANLFYHMDGEERATGNPDVGSASPVAASRTRNGGHICW
jgi:hypothetical protein